MVHPALRVKSTSIGSGARRVCYSLLQSIALLPSNLFVENRYSLHVSNRANHRNASSTFDVFRVVACVV